MLRSTAHPPYAVGRSIGLTDARWTSGFWASRIATCREGLIPALGRIMQDEQRVRFVGNFEVAAGRTRGNHRGPKWNDGDFYKWMEAAAAMLALGDSPQLRQQLDDLIELVAAAQDADGYIHTDVQIRQRNGEGAVRFANPMDFEMYNMGHLMSAACVHHAATGETTLLQCAVKAADLLAMQFAQPSPPTARHGICPAHLMGLVDLYRTTGDRRHVDLAMKLLNMRDLVVNGDDDNQDRLPFRQQRQAVGHAVRATYLYAGAADLYSELGDDSLMQTLQSVWQDLVSKKLYITGGCGALFDGASPDGSADQLSITRVHQAFGRNYQLPHSTAHNETCAAIGNLLWNWRMLLLTGECRFAGMVEHTLFNSVLAGVSLDGTRFFYTNTLRQLEPMPVELRWNRHRQGYISCFCCPPNVARVLARTAQYTYFASDSDLWVVLYGSNRLRTKFGDEELVLEQKTDYPWSDRIRLEIQHAPTKPLSLRLRIPQWCSQGSVRINGEQSNAEPIAAGTFHHLRRRWNSGDVIELSLPMPVRKVQANPLVEESSHQVAIMRGPLVYCLETADLPEGIRVLDVAIPLAAEFRPDRDPQLPGLTVLRGTALAHQGEPWNGQLYREVGATVRRPIPITLVPYFAWDNRAAGEMTVWLPVAE